MNWNFIDTGFNTGKFNMEFDFKLIESAKKDNAVLRFFRWDPFCISFGANQNYSTINLAKVKEENLDVVKRPTGGRAILHAEELTYSVVYPINKSISPKKLYEEINLALMQGLIYYDDLFENISLENTQPNFAQFYKEQKSALCFAVSAKSELKFDNKKIVGSAQRKIGDFVLQHGSILCGDYHKKIVEYLNLPNKELLALKNEINLTTTEIETVTGYKTDYNKLSASIKKGFEDHFKANLYEVENDVLVSIQD